jgi:hypothetical protein
MKTMGNSPGMDSLKTELLKNKEDTGIGRE